MTNRLRSFFRVSSWITCTSVLLCGAKGALSQKPGTNVELHANSHITARDIGLPAYPGATLLKDDDNSSSVDLGVTFGDFHFKMMVANYLTGHSPTEVLAFYRKSLSHYGEVLECDHGKPVGSVTATRSGLTCADDEGGHVQVNDSKDSSNGHELRAGSPLRYRLVGIDKPKDGATHFGLVYLELPKDSDEKQK
ncbi:hypothetical protein [Tunturiibacter psychrotolerans]|uniref:hypothetical protein n=1 Tax=Tunturiibacter psychrotolerans TaxID=3069686 RepID=UPI003D258DCC